MAAVLLVATVLYAITASISHAAENPDGVAVIIGNKSYSHTDVPEVSFAHNDADAIKRYVIETLGFRERNVIDLRDATVAELEGVFGNERSHKGDLWGYVRMGRSDVVVFYSGHGMPGFKDGRSYLLPSDVAAGRVEISGYPLDVLYDNLGKLETRSALVLIDACFSGGSAGGTLVPAGSFAVVPKQDVSVPGGLTVLTAAGPDEIASWDKEAELGLFTAHLLTALGGEADGKGYGDENGEVTLAEVKTYLDEEMTYQAQRRYGREQTAMVIGVSKIVLATYTPGEIVPPVTEPLFTVEEMDLDMYALKNARVRAGPTTTATSVLTTLDVGSRVMVTGKVEGRDWYRVALAGGDVGFVFGKLLGEDAPGDETQVAVGIYPPAYEPGDTFQDCDDCPEMVVVPAGSFRMGDLNGGGYKDEKPVHEVTIPQPFAAGVYEVTFRQWDGCVAGGGCGGYRPNDGGWGRGDRPVINVSWKDAKSYVAWLSREAGHEYRLLSEAEWEYAARAGTTTKYHWGYIFFSSRVNSDGRKTVPVGSYAANGFGLHDMHGNVWEWVEDCWHDSYAGAPSDGRAWASGGDCSLRVLRGGSWINYPRILRAAYRYLDVVDFRVNKIGFRVARTLFTP